MSISYIRNDFPFIINAERRKKNKIYLDNAATSQKPIVVIESEKAFYQKQCSNIYRGRNLLSNTLEKKIYKCRKAICKFINASYASEIIFTSGTTESINLIAHSLKTNTLKADDEIIISIMEHNSNILPWQIISYLLNVQLKIILLSKNNELNEENYKKIISRKTKIVAIAHVSNILGVLNPIKRLIKLAHSYGALVLIDGTQAIQHININIRELNCDFYVFSSNKIYGPMGVGILYIKKKLILKIFPYKLGGNIAKNINKYNKFLFINNQKKLEAGTLNIGGIVGLSYAINYLQLLKKNIIRNYEKSLLLYAKNLLNKVSKIIIYNISNKYIPILIFNIKNIHPHDLNKFLNKHNIYIRTGYNCGELLLKELKLRSICRISFAFYNTYHEINLLYYVILKAIKFLY